MGLQKAAKKKNTESLKPYQKWYWLNILVSFVVLYAWLSIEIHIPRAITFMRAATLLVEGERISSLWAFMGDIKKSCYPQQLNQTLVKTDSEYFSITNKIETCIEKICRRTPDKLSKPEEDNTKILRSVFGQTTQVYLENCHDMRVSFPDMPTLACPLFLKYLKPGGLVSLKVGDTTFQDVPARSLSKICRIDDQEEIPIEITYSLKIPN